MVLSLWGMSKKNGARRLVGTVSVGRQLMGPNGGQRSAVPCFGHLTTKVPRNGRLSTHALGSDDQGKETAKPCPRSDGLPGIPVIEKDVDGGVYDGHRDCVGVGDRQVGKEGEQHG